MTLATCQGRRCRGLLGSDHLIELSLRSEARLRCAPRCRGTGSHDAGEVRTCTDIALALAPDVLALLLPSRRRWARRGCHSLFIETLLSIWRHDPFGRPRVVLHNGHHLL